MTVPFSRVPSNLRTPLYYVEFDNSMANTATTTQRTLLIGEPPVDLRKTLHTLGHVTGRVPHGQVPTLLRRARYGLNLVPDQLPYSQQTSTKLIEYCAAGLPVVSTDYDWVRAFEARHGARFAYLPIPDMAGCVVPDVSTLAWPRVLERLALWRRLGLCP